MRNKLKQKAIQVCVRCKHPPCQYCKTWCDVLLYSLQDKGYIKPADKKAKSINWPVPCCGGRCGKLENIALKKGKIYNFAVHLK